MLQKVLVVLVGIVMSVVGALSPSGLFASQPSVDITPVAGGPVAEEPLATMRTLDGASFAKVSVLWIEVDGRRVLDDAWGAGAVDELRFKVGVKDVQNLALAVGDRMVPLQPTDVLTVRMFNGEFAFRKMGTADATLQLQGTVKTALLNAGGSKNSVRTELGGTGGDDASLAPPRGGTREVAYVVLTTGEKLQTVAVQDGGARLYTEEALDRASAANAPGNLLAKWVKIDGKLLQEYTWGDGVVSSIEFEPADAGKGGVVLAFNGDAAEVAAGTRVLVKDFVGEYLVYQVANGMLRVRLDGYAADMILNAAGAAAPQVGNGQPNAFFEYEPRNPKTTDTIRFTDRSTDDTRVVLRLWSFGDEGTSVLPNPTHRFTKPGTYVVKLNVTDTDRNYAEWTEIIEVGNAPPIPDFDFWPKIVTTDTLVSFTDDSTDTDGSVKSYEWNFGDGTAKDDRRHPTHKFARTGSVTVTLTVTDNLGGKASISKLVEVRNTPPTANFTYAPNDIQTLVPVQFQDTSDDRDGEIRKREWKFGDGANASGRAPTHVFKRPGLYTVSLTVTDDAGDSDTTTTQLFVRNRLPIVNFSWSPHGSPADKPVHFTSLADDLDGTVLTHEWDFGDGTSALEPNPVHVFQRSGVYKVKLTVTDNSLERNSTTIDVGILNAIPRAAMNINPKPAFRGADVVFADVSTDPDGDVIVNRTWFLGNDVIIQDKQVVTWRFNQSGEIPIKLVVRDAAGSVAETSTKLTVINRPPVISNATVSPLFPIVDQPAVFSVQGVDLDRQPNDPPLQYEWRFSDGAILSGENVSRVFGAPGRVTATVRAIDGENGKSNPLTVVADVDYASPVAAILATPAPTTIVVTGDTVKFESLSTSPNGPITSHRWDFGDGSPIKEGASVTHVFTSSGAREVRLTVTDNLSRSSTTSVTMTVNGRPTAAFESSPGGIVPKATPVRFTDLSTDPDGDAIVAWKWTFDDGTSSNLRNPWHNFTRPGRHNVTLTVTDARGATDSEMRIVRIENARPLARFSPPLNAVVGEPVGFTDASVDPDGTPIVAWTWNFGDGTSSRLQHPTHTFASSGRYTVTLAVTDGELASRAEPGSYHVLRVGADHPLQVDVKGILPDNRPADLVAGGYTLRARLGHLGGGYTDYTVTQPNGQGLTLTLARGTWMTGDTLTLYLEAPGVFTGRLERQFSVKDADTTLATTFQIPLALNATINATAGQFTTLSTVPIVVPNDGVTPEGDPVYRNMQEPFRGTGRVTLSDGVPLVGATVFVEARYVPIRAVGSVRDGANAPNNPLLGWCPAATVTTGADGKYSWIADHRSDCNFDELGLHPVGRWEVRAKVAYSFAIPDTSDVATIYVDPTGGLLWTLSSPP